MIRVLAITYSALIVVICIFVVLINFWVGVFYGKLKYSKSCPISLKEGIDRLFEEVKFDKKPLYFDDYVFVPLRDGSVIIRKIKMKDAAK